VRKAAVEAGSRDSVSRLVELFRFALI